MGTNRNTTALKRELDTFFGGTGLPVKTEDLARHLASRGVLVPSALTDAECQLAWNAANSLAEAAPPVPMQAGWPFSPGAMRAELERIAKEQV